ncbi:Serine/threonine-protein kinase HAL4/SAT4 [Cytospora mali]|uniref:Serine/threonine-protein kinase HAL4/SAT4 n=1 Tax=Cytospora mali TaxID=578113 RepID=A0A194W932_CYTMA|nr:Serine/threonine-protein kinase HAL4/SAT4 [Valsa mali]
MAFSAVLAPPAASQTSSSTASASHSENPQDDGSSLSSSPPQYPTHLSNPIYEESDEDSECVSHNEPVTPVSGRQSSDFQAQRVHNHDNQPVIADNSLSSFPSIQPESTSTISNPKIDLRQVPSTNQGSKIGTNTDTENPLNLHNSTANPRASISTRPVSPPSTVRTSAEDDQPTPVQDYRRKSVSSFKRTMSNLNLFRRNAPSADGQPPFLVVAPQDPTEPTRRWSMHRSSATTPRSTSPPSPDSQTFDGREEQNQDSLAPGSDDLMSKKSRASTGLTLRSRAVNFAMGNGRHAKQPTGRRRANSFDASRRHAQRHQDGEPDVGPRNVFYAGPETGVGVKARRLSLSLPDEINVEVVELTSEFEYSNKRALANTPFARMATKKVGKGATATVRVMARKGFPEELYAVKTFRGKSGGETKDEYDKKVKSEFSLAKSLHHPNVVEAVRLCIDHSKWCHVMEYCAGGDLHTLVKKHKYLKSEEREGDRLCLFKQLIQGLNYLHSNGIAHRDIKLENLLLTKDSKLKITDFGVSEVFTGIHPAARESGGECGRQMGKVRLCKPGICGSQPWMAPEVLAKEKEYDPRKLDVWSAGLVMIALMCGGMLWDKAEENAPGCQNYTALVKTFEKWDAEHPDGTTHYTESEYPKYKFFDFFIERPPLRRVLLMMLNPDPDKRATIDQIVNYRWVKNIECCQLESYDDPAVVIDATQSSTFNAKGTRKIYCHNHLPPGLSTPKSHSLGAMPGQAGY